MEELKCMFGCPYHPATGHVLDRKSMAVLCGMHTRAFFNWIRGHTKKRWGKLNFYEEAARSVRVK